MTKYRVYDQFKDQERTVTMSLKLAVGDKLKATIKGYGKTVLRVLEVLSA